MIFFRTVAGIDPALGIRGAAMNTSTNSTPLLTIDPASEVTLQQQIYNGVLSDIARGIRRPGDRLETEQALSRRTGVSPGTARKAYSDLARDGVVKAQRGRGTFVAPIDRNAVIFTYARKRLSAPLADLLSLGLSFSEIDQIYAQARETIRG